MECVLPADAGQAHARPELIHCTRALSDDGFGDCNLAMIARLDPEQQVSGRCYLTDGDGGAKLTKDAWFVVRNRYKDDIASAASKKSKGYKVKTRLKSSARRAREALSAEESAEAAGATEEISAKVADEEPEEASVEARKSPKRTKRKPDFNMVIVLLAVIAALGAILICLQSRPHTT